MKHLLILIALAASAQQIKINPITGLPDLVGGGGSGGATSVTAGATGALVISPTTGAVVADVDTAYVPNKAGAETIIGNWTFYDTTAVTGSTLLTVRAGAGQSGNLQSWQNNGGGDIANVNSSGAMLANDFYNKNDSWYQTGTSVLQGSNVVVKWSSTTSQGGTADAGFARNADGIVEVNNGVAGTLRDLIQRHPLAGGTSPTITSGFGTTPSIAGKDAAGRITVGSGGTAATGTITFGTAWATAPVCTAANETTQLALFPTATTTTLVLASTTPFTAADKLVYQCVGY